MAILLTSPEFSFMDIVAPTETCGWSERPCLPVFNLGDLSFQVIATVTGADKATFNNDPINAGITNDCDNPGILIANYTGEWTLTETGVGADPDIWIGNFGYVTQGTFPFFAVGECFGVMMFNNGGATTFGCFTQCFVKIGDECYTTKFIYRNNENAFDFDYTDPAFSNRIRLPLYLHSPTNPEEEKSYAKSDGSSVKLMHRIWKDYRVKGDYMTEDVIEKFTVMTAHDTVNITCTYSGVSDYFIRTEKVEPAWMEEQSPGIIVAQYLTTLRMASPRATINSNCV